LSRSITGWRLHFLCSRSPTAETRRRERRQCRCNGGRAQAPAASIRLRRWATAGQAIFRPASFKVKPRSFKPWNPERYRGGPPF
jgi:hypothetical protein